MKWNFLRIIELKLFLYDKRGINAGLRYTYKIIYENVNKLPVIAAYITHAALVR